MADNSETVISKLANDLMALINSKPRSPTKAEIEQLLSDVPELKARFLFVDPGKFERFAAAAGGGGGYPLGATTVTIPWKV